MTYRITGLDPAAFQPLFALSEEELEEHGMRRMTVTKKPSFPCRVSLVDRDIGETVILLNHVSHDVANPFRASHAIFVAEGAEQAEFVDEVPPVFDGRALSMRGFDRRGMMVTAMLAPPGGSEEVIRELFDNADVAAIHAHNAAYGCFSARIERN
jgi:hypothetical protein